MVHERVAECYVRFLVVFLHHSQEGTFCFVLNSQVIVCSDLKMSAKILLHCYQRKAYLTPSTGQSS